MKKFIPTFYKHDIFSIDYNYLKSIGITNIIYDIDNTLAKELKSPDKSVIDLISRLKNDGFNICLLSNNNIFRVEPVGKILGVDYIHTAIKPKKTGFKKALLNMKCNADNTIMIGDQILSDIVGANRIGMRSILVDPISKKEAPWTKVRRPLEHVIKSKFIQY